VGLRLRLLTFRRFAATSRLVGPGRSPVSILSQKFADKIIPLRVAVPRPR
jgi:hypothetical protein